MVCIYLLAGGFNALVDYCDRNLGADTVGMWSKLVGYFEFTRDVRDYVSAKQQVRDLGEAQTFIENYTPNDPAKIAMSTGEDQRLATEDEKEAAEAWKAYSTEEPQTPGIRQAISDLEGVHNKREQERKTEYFQEREAWKKLTPLEKSLKRSEYADLLRYRDQNKAQDDLTTAHDKVVGYI